MRARRAGPTLCVGAALVLGACSGGEGGGAEGTRVLKLGHVGAPGSLYDLSAVELARRVAERSEGRLRVDVFGSSQLGGDEAMLDRLRLGTLDLALPSTVMSSTIDAFGLFEMPYLVRDRDHMQRIEEAVVWPVLAPLAEERGFRILAVWENGFRHVTNNRRPIESPSDLEGIKLRTPRGVWRVKLFQALGANPTPMAFSEVFVGLQTGVIDGQENPLSQIVSARLHEVQTYLSLTGHVYSPAYVTAGASWPRLPPELQTLVAEEARRLQPFVYENAARLDDELLAELEASGTDVNRPTGEAFLAASRSVYDEFRATVPEGPALLEAVERVRTQPAPLPGPDSAGSGGSG